MNNMPLKLRKECAEDPYYRKCARKGPDCSGRITFEHVWMYAGKQIQEKFSIIPLCIYHHLGPGLNKKINKFISINRMTEEDMKKYPRENWLREKLILNRLYKK